jgi:hypothetical protein
MQQDGCRRNRFFEKNHNSSRHVRPAAAATIYVSAVATGK